MVNSHSNIRIKNALKLIESSQSIDSEAQDIASATLRSLPPNDTLEITVTDAQILTRIYRRRLEWAPNVSGVYELVRGLGQLSETEVAMTYLPGKNSQVVSIWFDIALTRIIGCVIGTDHRGDNSS